MKRSDEGDAAEVYELARAAARELRVQIERHPYVALAAGAGLGLVLGGARGARWIAPAAALAFRAGARWAAREGLRHLVAVPLRTAFNRAGAAASSPRPESR